LRENFRTHPIIISKRKKEDGNMERPMGIMSNLPDEQNCFHARACKQAKFEKP
jgi:hypothetical protein